MRPKAVYVLNEYLIVRCTHAGLVLCDLQPQPTELAWTEVDHRGIA
jgi:hypothetical protein